MKKFMYFAAALLVLVGCNKKDNIIENAPEGTPFEKGQKVTLTIGTGAQQGPNKVAGVDNTTDNQIDFVWEAGDQILVKVGENTSTFTLSSGAGSYYGEFTGEMPAGGTSFAIQYPIEVPNLTAQEYTTEKPIPADKMAFAAEGCVLGTTALLKAQYAMVQLNLYNTTEQKVGKIVFNDITCLFETVEDPFMATLNCTDEEGNGVTLSTNPAEPTPFYFIVPKGEYRFEVRVWNDDATPKKIAWFGTPAKQQFASNEGKVLCVNMPAREAKVEHTYVDLGAAGKWATINVGQDANGAVAVAPEDLGGAYDFDNAQISFTDWGTDWKMPSAIYTEGDEVLDADFNKLIAADNVTCTEVTDYLGTGCAGLLFVGKNDYKDNYIFLPARGQRDDGFWGSFWSSSEDISANLKCALDFASFIHEIHITHTDATKKYPVRLVKAATPTVDPKDVFNVGAIMKFTFHNEFGDYSMTYTYNGTKFEVIEIIQLGEDVTDKFAETFPVQVTDTYSFHFEFSEPTIYIDVDADAKTYVNKVTGYANLTGLFVNDVNILDQLTEVTN